MASIPPTSAAFQQPAPHSYPQPLPLPQASSSSSGSNGGHLPSGLGGYGGMMMGGGLGSSGPILAIAPPGQECLPDDETDLNELTDAQHETRFAETFARFWQAEGAEMDNLDIGTEQDFKTHNDLPLARIKRIMKSDEDVRMISAEAPVLFAKACEMFILDITLRSNQQAEKAKRKALQKEDVDAAIKNTPTYDFLVDMD